MTISLGFRAKDGVLLCSDRQLTVQGLHKYYDLKFREMKGKTWGMVFSFAWSPEMMNLLFEEVQQRFSVDTPPSPQEAKQKLADIADELYGRHKDFRVQQTLCAVSLPKEVLLLKVTGKVVTDAAPTEYLGVGDSSLVRFLTFLLVTPQMTAFRAAKVAIYIVTQANFYIDGCSGGPDTRFVEPNGRIIDYGGVNELEGIEEALIGLIQGHLPYLDNGLKELGQRIRDHYRTEELLSGKRPIKMG